MIVSLCLFKMRRVHVDEYITPIKIDLRVLVVKLVGCLKVLQGLLKIISVVVSKPSVVIMHRRFT